MIGRRTTSFVKQRRWSIATEAEVTSRPARVVADLPSLWIEAANFCGSEVLAGLHGDVGDRGQRAAQARPGTAAAGRAVTPAISAGAAIWPPATQRADCGSGLYRELQYPLDATTRRMELLAAGCACGWRSPR
jgi:hypothetical protein